MKTKNRELLNRAAGALEGLAANADMTSVSAEMLVNVTEWIDTVMTISNRIKSAEASREEAFKNNSISGVSYWDGYIDALKAFEEDEDERR